MGFEMSIERDRKFARLSALGEIDLEGSLAALRDLAAALEGETGFGVLLDGRETHYQPSWSDVQTMARESGQPNALQKHRIAVVVSTVAQFGLARMFVTYLEGVGCEGAAFRDLESAMEWLETSRSPKVGK